MDKPIIEASTEPAPTELVIEDIVPLTGLISGWQEGIPGMRVGGRRQLTIPPELAYGPAGGGHPLSGRTLVFVIDLINAG